MYFGLKICKKATGKKESIYNNMFANLAEQETLNTKNQPAGNRF
jgi:hypothetical protein